NRRRRSAGLDFARPSLGEEGNSRRNHAGSAEMTRNLVLIILGIVAYVGWDSFFVLQEYEQAIVTQFGEPKKTYRSPGIRAKIPFADTVRRMEKRMLGSDTAPAEYLTLDKKKLVADPISRWRIVDPLEFYKSVRDESGAKARL